MSYIRDDGSYQRPLSLPELIAAGIERAHFAYESSQGWLLHRSVRGLRTRAAMIAQSNSSDDEVSISQLVRCNEAVNWVYNLKKTDGLPSPEECAFATSAYFLIKMARAGKQIAQPSNLVNEFWDGPTCPEDRKIPLIGVLGEVIVLPAIDESNRFDEQLRRSRTMQPLSRAIRYTEILTLTRSDMGTMIDKNVCCGSAEEAHLYLTETLEKRTRLVAALDLPQTSEFSLLERHIIQYVENFHGLTHVRSRETTIADSRIISPPRPPRPTKPRATSAKEAGHELAHL